MFEISVGHVEHLAAAVSVEAGDETFSSAVIAELGDLASECCATLAYLRLSAIPVVPPRLLASSPNAMAGATALAEDLLQQPEFRALAQPGIHLLGPDTRSEHRVLRRHGIETAWLVVAGRSLVGCNHALIGFSEGPEFGACDLRALQFRINLLVGLACDRLIAQAAKGQKVASPMSQLEPLLNRREQGIVCLLLEGYRVGTIAQRLYVSPHTVRNDLKRIFRKLGVHSQAALIAAVRSEAGGDDWRPLDDR